MKLTASTHTFVVGGHAWYMHGPLICYGAVLDVTHDVPTEYGPTSMYKMSIQTSNSATPDTAPLYRVGGEAMVPKVYLHTTYFDLRRFHFLYGPPN